MISVFPHRRQSCAASQSAMLASNCIVSEGVVPGIRFICLPPLSDSVRDDIVDEILPLGLCKPVILFVAFPQIQKQTKRHEPDFILDQMKMGQSVIKKPGK